MGGVWVAWHGVGSLFSTVYLLSSAPRLSARLSNMQGSFPLHWPLINSDHLRDRLGKAQLDKKRIADADRLALQDPNHRWGCEPLNCCVWLGEQRQLASELRGWTGCSRNIHRKTRLMCTCPSAAG